MIQLKNISTSLGSQRIFNNLSFEINDGEQIAIVGPSGSGKTTLLRILAGQMMTNGEVVTLKGLSIAFVEQQHKFRNLSNTTTFYYQQRFNSSDAEDAITVKEYLEEELDGKDLSDEKTENMLHQLHVVDLLDRRLIQLSNGENKRVQLAKTLLTSPDVLLLDNPYLGLDQEARSLLTSILESLIKAGLTVVMTTSSHSLPTLITHVLLLDTKGGIDKLTRSEYENQFTSTGFGSIEIDKKLLERLLTSGQDQQFDSIILMNNVRVSYHGKDILKNINWHVKPGDRWALSGPNGAGKSTLLSLINGDNPQAYSNEIYLFDKQRGRGESIWDIKHKIGYVSPELHLFFESTTTVFNAVASGLFDTIGLFRKLNEEQEQQVIDWLQLLQLEKYAHKLLVHLPLGVQRLTLLTRALIKNPPLLLLDEPAQGLDAQQAYLFKNIIEQICEHTDKTLIYVSHYKEEIPSSVTKFIQLQGGEISYIS